MDILEAKDGSVAETVESRFEEQKLREKLKCLSPRERKVIELRYGLSDCESQTQREIAKILNISRSYVSHREAGDLEAAQSHECRRLLVSSRTSSNTD